MTGFNASCVSLSGAGGQLAGLEAADAAEGGASRENGAAGATGPAPPSVVFIATVAPSAVGMLEVQVAAGCATDAGGNANIAPSNRVQASPSPMACYYSLLRIFPALPHPMIVAQYHPSTSFISTSALHKLRTIELGVDSLICR